MADWPAFKQPNWDAPLKAYVDAVSGGLTVVQYDSGWTERGDAAVVLWLGGTIDTPPPGEGSDIWLRDVS